MSIDRLLTNVLQQYQDVHDGARTEKIYGSTTALLTNLSNPLNLSLLTSQILIAPAIWGHRDGMRTCLRIISIFNTAAIHVRRNELENEKHKGPRASSRLSSNAWAAAVLKGADDQSSRWQHLLVFSGVLMGMESNNRNSLSGNMRRTVEQAVVTAANLAFHRSEPHPPAPAGPVIMALNYTFPLLSEASRTSLDCDALVPVATRAMLGSEGLQDGLFLHGIDSDVRQAEERFMWPESSASFMHLRQFEQKPLMQGLGPLSRVMAYAVQHARNSNVVLQLQDDLVAFTGRFLQHWQSNKLSELESSEEEVYLTPETLQVTWPALWMFLKKIMYAIVAVLQAVVARSLLDKHLMKPTIAPAVAAKTLHCLRSIYFISSRNGSDAFQAYSFVYLTSLDILSRYASASTIFLQETKSLTPPGVIPSHPLNRTLDLFYLNVAEHLPLHLSPEACDALIIQPATTYLSHKNVSPLSPRMTELFESAHSAVLSVLSCPHNAPITANVVPFYAETLFTSFPNHISPRQFRVAFKTVMQILSPPFPIAESHPLLAETLLEMVRYRATVANTAPLEPLPHHHRQGKNDDDKQEEEEQQVLSEQSTLVLTLIDSLPFLRLRIFEEWMTLAAKAINGIKDGGFRETCKRRFWEVLVSGEMDVERSAIGVAWWGTKGGREAVLFGEEMGSQRGQQKWLMSGALSPPPPERSKL
ncbi:putative PEX8 peroxisomal biogenesis factor 8 [Podospora fimiseda]|uniref:PEX8 peroxisomal biogenesis factor 8 n=1 Tax=Podospora fimiseda TaxID=252190 RepID=A0AAN7H0H6_9PEZI|nr:putative PEX8 peroxisomal biogenesis factor 8 [Podospora fimiseda]